MTAGHPWDIAALRELHLRMLQGIRGQLLSTSAEEAWARRLNCRRTSFGSCVPALNKRHHRRCIGCGATITRQPNRGGEALTHAEVVATVGAAACNRVCQRASTADVNAQHVVVT